jgi:hypothetical protein
LGAENYRRMAMVERSRQSDATTVPRVRVLNWGWGSRAAASPDGATGVPLETLPMIGRRQGFEAGESGWGQRRIEEDDNEIGGRPGRVMRCSDGGTTSSLVITGGGGPI